jgi:sulfur-oxidizing protein SoxA
MRALALTLALALAAPAAAQEAPVSGYDYLMPETQALQDDDFANPGMLWVDQGAAIWDSAGCSGCHAAAEMVGVGARYPLWSGDEQRILTLTDRINLCRTENQDAPAYAHDDADLVALTTWIRHQSRGLPVSVAIDGPAAAAFERGRIYYETPRGQLDLSCADCHVRNEGNRLRGEIVSQGQVNGFPIYRQLWQDIGSVDRMIRWCHESVRAEPPAEGDPMWADLELYLSARGNGLTVETPALRR